MKFIGKIFKWVGVIFVVFMGIGFIASSSYETRNATVESSVPDAKVAKTTKVLTPVSNLTWLTIDRNGKKMTDLQFEAFAETVKGKRIIWKASVIDVKACTFSDCYTVSLDFNKPSRFPSLDAEIEITKELALTLNKGQIIKIDGVITSVLEAVGMVYVKFDDSSIKLIL